MADLNKVSKYLDEGRLDLARDAIDEALDRNPDDEEALAYQQALEEAEALGSEEGELEGVESGLEVGEEMGEELGEEVVESDFKTTADNLLVESFRLEDEGDIQGSTEILTELMALIQEKIESLQSVPQE